MQFAVCNSQTPESSPFHIYLVGASYFGKSLIEKNEKYQQCGEFVDAILKG